MKPDWKDAPEWARWLAQDRDGEWCWHLNRPNANQLNQEWSNGSVQWEYAYPKPEENLDWEETLEPRPAAIGESCE